jgi:hypothetical protein
MATARLFSAEDAAEQLDCPHELEDWPAAARSAMAGTVVTAIPAVGEVYDSGLPDGKECMASPSTSRLTHCSPAAPHTNSTATFQPRPLEDAAVNLDEDAESVDLEAQVPAEAAAAPAAVHVSVMSRLMSGGEMTVSSHVTCMCWAPH